MISFLSYVHQAVRSHCDADAWSIEEASDSNRPWITVLRTEPIPIQGWKLHVSANEGSALEILTRVLPLLLSEGASFKLAASIAKLNDLNEGFGGLSQVGKFITVYPRDDVQATALAVKLDRATYDFQGPLIPSDRPLRVGSLVQYRYGGFGDLFLQTRMGQILPALRTPSGELVPDMRRPRYTPPEWATDPFLAAGVADNVGQRTRLLGRRYLIIANVCESARGEVFSAIDVLAAQTCILKQARRYAVVGRDGRDAWDRLRHEMAILGRLSPDDRFPEVLDLVQQDDELFLVMTEIGGVTLEQFIRGAVAQGCFPSHEQLFNWARQLISILRKIHEKGIIYRDLKSSNVIVGEDGCLRLIDFELAAQIETPTAAGRGTRGYASPQQDAGQAPTASDDIYGLGALLYFAATGAEPSLAPHPFNLLNRAIALLNPEARSGLVHLIEGCLDTDPSGRFPSTVELEDVLLQYEGETACVPQSASHEAIGENEIDDLEYLRLAARLGDTLCHMARSDPDDRLFWCSAHENTDGVQARDLSIGSAGAVLALADLVSQFGQSDHSDVLRRAAHSLTLSKHFPNGFLPGLYVGEAGVGAALLRAGQILRDADLIENALEKGRLIAREPYLSPDIFNGTAGRLRFHLWLWDETSDPEQLKYAKEAGRDLLNSARGDKENGIWWTIPPGYDGLSGSSYVGYAHGAAGIADSLLDLFEITGDESLLAVVRHAGAWIARHAIETLEDSAGLDWPDVPGGSSIGPFWCHGAAGVGQFFLHAARSGVMTVAQELTTRAAMSAAKGARWSNPTQCHGLAGNIEFLLDVFQTTGELHYLHEARLLGHILQSFALESEGFLVWPSESPAVVTPDYMVGFAGVAACLLRLGAPERLPRQLSRSGFSNVLVVSKPLSIDQM
ncbi:MAG TPA: class IV lanthionine synthetase LanL [Candidatus Angelobacter sp.]|jgi:serine/threonine protein kinase